MKGTYYNISYNGESLLEVFATSPYRAKQKAIRALENRRCGMNMARLTVSASNHKVFTLEAAP